MQYLVAFDFIKSIAIKYCKGMKAVYSNGLLNILANATIVARYPKKGGL